MKAFRYFLLALVLSALAVPGRADTSQPQKPTLNIEAAMRAWQERWVVLTGADQIFGLGNPNGYKMIVWPLNAEGVSPGPYPADCFYAKDMQDPKKAAVLVSKFIVAMSTSMGQAGAPGGFGAIRRFDPLWASWSLPFPDGPTTSSSTDGLFRWLDSNNQWVRRDIAAAPWASDFSSVTISNYETKFQTVVSHWLNNPVRVLWRFSPTTGTDYNWTHRVARADYADCLTCMACVTGNCVGGGCMVNLGTPGNRGVNVAISLGKGSQGEMGSLQIYAETPSLDLATPYKLAVRLNARVHNTTGGGGGVVDSEGYAIYDDSTFIAKGYPLLRQVVFPQGLVDIVPDVGEPSYGYTLYFYDNDHRGTRPGRFFVPAAGGAYKTIRIANPARQPTDFNRLEITEGTGRSFRYAYTPAAGAGTFASWAKTEDDGSTEKIETGWISGTGTAVGDVQQEVYSLIDGSGQTAFKERTKRQIFPWNIDSVTSLPYTGRGRRDEMVEKVTDPDVGGKQIATVYRYYDDVATTSPNYARLKQNEAVNGSWARYEYDSQGRVTRTYTPYRDSAPPSIAAGAFSGDCRITETAYGSGPTETTTEAVVVGGVSSVISRSFVDEDESGSLYRVTKEVQATSAAATYSDPSNLVTITRSFKTGMFIGSPERVLYPDATVVLYTYSYVQGGNTTITESRGVPNSGSPLTATDIVAGSRSTRVTNPQGQAVSQIVVDVASGIRTENTTYYNFDEFGRWRSAVDIAGRVETRAFDCCGITSTTDVTGVRTDYAYDVMRRLTRETRYLATTNTPISDVGYTYDGAGRRLKTTRYSVGDSADPTTPGSIVLETAQYNLAGQQVSSTTPNGQTLFAETITGGHRVAAVTFPDGSKQVQVFRADGSLASVSGSAVAPVNYDQGVDAEGSFIKTTKVGDGGALTEWTKDYVDFAGRSLKTVLADGAAVIRTYNSKGQLASLTTPPDSGTAAVTTLYSYNALGQLELTAVDLDHNGSVDFNGTDRITKSVQDIAETVHDTVTYAVHRTTTSSWSINGTDASVVVNTAEASVDGTHTWLTKNGVTTTTTTSLGGNGTRAVTTTVPDGSQDVQTHSGGRLISSVSTAGGVQLGRADISYDGHGRVEASTDARNGTTRYKYFNNDQIKSVTTPDPDTTRMGEGYDAQVTQFVYDEMGRPTTQILPDGGVVNFRYWPTGLLKRTWGARVYPQQTTYDAQGRLKILATWREFADESAFDSASGRSVTTWNYNPQRGWLDNKRYNDNTGPAYLYYPSGQLKQRIWARGTTATYTYNLAGEISAVAYSDSTPAVSLSYDRLGRISQVTDAAGTLVTGYHGNTVLPTREAYGAGLINGSEVTRSYDALLRPSLLNVPAAGYTVGFSYREGSRLDTVSSLVGGVPLAHTYTYHANSPLVATFTQKRGAATSVVTTRTYDLLNRLTAIVAAPSAGTNVAAVYGYNTANQRVSATESDGKFWDYTYDPLGQVTSGTKKLSDGTPLLGHDLNYRFDANGNRVSSTANSALTAYNLDPMGLNQYQTRTVPSQVDITGSADTAANVTVNLLPADRQGELFHTQLSFNNTTNPAWQPVTVVAAKAGAGPGGTDAIQKQTGNVFVAKTPENFSYDLDGNLLSDGKWSYVWNAENRLVAMETAAAAAAAGAARQKLEFLYDAQGRRVQKKVSNWTGSAYVVVSDTRFIYDGWNLLAELNGMISNTVTRTYVWGADLSGSLQGAGGVGGLLALTSSGSSYIPTFDGNGNVVSLINTQDGSISAEYAYGPFGEVIRATGAAAPSNPFGFSTKYLDRETSCSYYGHRYYNPSNGRWLSRDPMEEQGGSNLYGMVANDPCDEADYLGLEILVHATTTAEVASKIFEDGLKPGRWPNIWMSGPGSFVPDHPVKLTYDINVSMAKEVPCDVISQALKAGRGAKNGSAMGNAIWSHINEWIQAQPEGLWKVPTGEGGRLVQAGQAKGYHYAFKSNAVWKSFKPRFLRVTGAIGIKLPKYLKVGGKVLVFVGLAMDAYEIATADNKPRTITSVAFGWAGATAGAALGAKGGAVAGGAVGVWVFGAGVVPGAGIGGVVGGIGGGIGGYFFGRKVGEIVYDIVETGFEY